MNRSAVILLVATLSLAVDGCALKGEPVDNWTVQTPPPPTNSISFGCLSPDGVLRRTAWRPFLRGDKVFAEVIASDDERKKSGLAKYDDADLASGGRGSTYAHEAVNVDDGVFVGYRVRDEFGRTQYGGGTVLWFDRDGKYSGLPVEWPSRAGPRGFVGFMARDAEVFALLEERRGGYAFRLGPGEEQTVTVLAKRAQRRRFQDVGYFPGPPGPHSLVNDRTFLMISFNALVRGDLDGKFEKLYQSASLITTQHILVVPNGTIYLGSRWMVVRLTPDKGGYREEWLRPPTTPADCPYVSKSGKRP